MKQADFDFKLKILELETLRDISKEISSVLEIDNLMEEITARTLGLLDASGCCLMLIDGDKPSHLRIASSFPNSDLVGRSVPIRRGILQEIALKGEVKLLNKLSKNSLSALPINCQKFLGVPIRSQERTLGILCAFDKETRDGSIIDFSESDQGLLYGFASQAAIALKNAQLYDSLKKANKEIHDTYIATMDALVSALDLRDSETSNHSRRVVEYSIMIAKVMGIEERKLEHLRWGAILHDIGKIGVSDAILRKPGPLTKEERKELENHPGIGYNMLKKIEFLKDVMPVVLHHQEKYDGSGYPNRLSGERIPMGARIFAVADTFDAMTSDRPYRKALSYEEARDEIKRCSGTQFDPQVVEAFLKIPKEKWEAVRKALGPK